MSARQSTHMKTTQSPPASPIATTSHRDAMEIDSLRTQPHSQVSTLRTQPSGSTDLSDQQKGGLEQDGVSLPAQEASDNKKSVIVTHTNVNSSSSSMGGGDKSQSDRGDEGPPVGVRPMVAPSTSQQNIPKDSRRQLREAGDSIDKIRLNELAHFQTMNINTRNDSYMNALFGRVPDEKQYYREAAREAEMRATATTEQLKRHQAEFRMSFQNLENEKRELEAELEESRATVQHLLDRMTHGKADGRWNPMSDSDIQEKLNNLEKEIWGWAKQHASQKMPDKDVLTCDPKFMSWASPFLHYTPDGQLPNSFVGAVQKLKGKLPALMLSAALAHNIQRAFFESPFFCIPDQADAFMQILTEMKRFDTFEESRRSNEAHVWRSSLWRMLYPPDLKNPTNSKNPVHESTYKRIQIYCTIVEQNFLSGHAKVFLSRDGDRQGQSRTLREILMNAAKIAAGLYTQRTYLDTFDLEAFNRNRQSFNVNSPLMKAHTLNRVDVENNSNNGRRVMLVTRPAILAFDANDTRGLDGGEYRILAEAVVYLEDLPGRG